MHINLDWLSAARVAHNPTVLLLCPPLVRSRGVLTVLGLITPLYLSSDRACEVSWVMDLTPPGRVETDHGINIHFAKSKYHAKSIVLI